MVKNVAYVSHPEMKTEKEFIQYSLEVKNKKNPNKVISL